MKCVTSNNRALLKKLFSFILMSVFAFVLVALNLDVQPVEALIKDDTFEILEFDGTYSWETSLDAQTGASDYVTYSDLRDNVCKYTTSLSTCQTSLGSRYVRFDTSEELYRFSVDVSFEEIYITGVTAEDNKLSDAKISWLLSLTYKLGNDLDYSVMQSKAFIPIGYAFTDVAQTSYTRSFTGTFDGQGFVIDNLYLAGYDYLIYEDEEDSEPIDIALSDYYSMFNYNEGTIKNFGLTDPNLEINNYHPNITKLSNIVGFNMSSGLIENVYVIDSRNSVTEAGIRYAVGTAAQTFQAAGIVHTNQGTFKSAYYSSLIVVNGFYINKFNTQPVLYLNQGTVSNLVYDLDVYEYPTVTVNYQTFTISAPNSNALGETTATLKSTSSSLSSLTHVENSVTKSIWYFYSSDGYPLLKGFEYSGGNYLIYDAIDFKFFSDVQTFSTINYSTNSTTYKDSNYILMDSIDMSTIAPDAYVIPSGTFTGKLSGYNASGTDLGDNYYIHHLSISEGVLRGEDYYAGIFSILGAGAEVSNLNFSESTVSFTNTDEYYSKDFYIGAIAGQMIGGTINNVLLDVDIDLGTQAIGKTYMGSAVGKASGTITNLSNNGDLTGNTHVYSSSYIVEPVISIGGIVGAAETYSLVMDDVVNNGVINGFETTSEFDLESGTTSIQVNIGGVIGYVLNSNSSNHEFTDLSNKGNINVNHVVDTYETAYQYVGGVIGHFSGDAPDLEDSGTYKFANFYNEGDVNYTYSSSDGDVLASGIVVNNATEAIEYALLFNHGNFGFTYGLATYSQTQFTYVALVNDVSSSGVTISRAYNYSDFSYDDNVYYRVSPLYNSVNNNSTLLRYVANYGDIDYFDNPGTSTLALAADTYISGITLESNVNYSNVYTYGEINVVDINVGSYDLYVAGFSRTLAIDHYLKNSLNDSDISVAEIYGSGNIYIAGLININHAGDLHTQADPAPDNASPIATEGIIDTLNSGEITTSYGLEIDSLYGIRGTSNTFIGGIATLNDGSIQDVANLGDIKAWNANTSVDFDAYTDTYSAGRLHNYDSGIAAGGICSIAISGDSRIYDSSNNGDVLVSAYKYVRAGGVLGVSLYSEATSGGITSSQGLSNDINESILSNGMNFGNISALSNTIHNYTVDGIYINDYIYYNATYNDTATNFYVNDVVGNQERPPIYSSAGGVIGYGLSFMQNMLNHGTISATDVAGGIVGATYALGQSTTTVNIQTAINYGDVEPVDNSDVSTTLNKYSMSIAQIESLYMTGQEREDFLYPDNGSSNPLTITPGKKRGFGGIFGRLQRGNSGYMTSGGAGEFTFIVNANPNIDLIGRLDQVDRFFSTSRFYIFTDAIYYSAKVDDTTQVVFTGYTVYYQEVRNITGSSGDWNYDVYKVYGKQIGNSWSSFIYEEFITSENSTDTNAPYSEGDRYNNDNNEYYGGGIEIPWITEDASQTSNDAEEYMYDENFDMRTLDTLTEYIYYMPNELLADRFDSPRPNGMYVLSTTAGEEFGLVLPRNINIEDIRPIDEDHIGQISLDIDYDNVSSTYTKNFSTAIEDAFEDLKQTKFNDKADLIADDISSLTLTEVGGSNNVLTNLDADTDFDDTNKTVTFTIALAAFNSSQTTASFAVTSASTSSGALIAESPYDRYGSNPTTLELETYRGLLLPEIDDGISTSYPADLTVTIPASAANVSVGYFTVFAEAFLGDNLYAKSAYYTDYEVFINFIEPGLGDNELDQVSFNGGTYTTVASPTNEVYDIRSLGDVNALGSIAMHFIDETSILATGYDFKDNFVVYYNGVEVDASNYTVTSVPVDSSGNYYITFEFVGATKSGDYYFEYSYFPTSTVYTIQFDKAASTSNDILNFEYYSDGTSLSIGTSTINSNINLGYPVSSYMSTSTDNFSSTVDGSALNYESNTTFDIDLFIAGTLEISPFASVTSARLVEVTYDVNGYKTYHLEYIIQNEAGGSGSTKVYNHYLVERTVDIESVLKDGNNVVLADIHTSREALNTEFTVDLGFDQLLNLYELDTGANSYLEISVTGVDHDSVAYQPSEITGLTYSASDYLYIYMSYDTLPGVYTFTFSYVRESSAATITFATQLEITKDLGTNAYLTDIEFSDIPSETNYPDMYVVDVNGDPVTSSPYNPVVYFGGIDYDDSEENVIYYQIDGQVSNLPLYDYTPYFLDYLPYGASIQRWAYNSETTTWYWTTAVNASSDEVDKETLSTDFTVYPDTGLEPNDGDKVEIKYRVTAEDDSAYVDYFITVVDIEFNLSLVFDIYYCTGVGEETCSLAKDSVDFNDELVILNVKNLDTDGNDQAASELNPANFPTFTTINALNNNATQFFYTSSADYSYKFGRNKSGFYTFDVELKLDQYLNDLYTYEIKYGDYYLNDASGYISGLSGKYFYIGSSITMRTRFFSVYIRSIDTPETDTPFGLFDFFKSWFY